MSRALLVLTAALSALLAGCDAPGPSGGGRTPSYSSSPPPGSPPYAYYLTAFGGPDDSCYLGTPACGGKVVDGAWYYSTGAAAYGCHSKLKLAANGKCVVVEVVDNGPASSVEQKAAANCGGTGDIIDASPLAAKQLFNTSSAGWSDCLAIEVTPVDTSTPTGPIACGSTAPSCGDGALGDGELCDTAIPAGSPGACPSSCDDGDPCTSDQLVGSGCQATCKHSEICSNACGNGQVDPGEWCDIAIAGGKPGACPTSCDDGDPCTDDRLIGKDCLAICANPRLAQCGSPPPAATGAARPSGSPCAGNADCLTGQCLPTLSGFPGGLCSQPCESSCARVEGDVDSACLLLVADSPGLGAFCYALCDPDTGTGCRDGYSCATRGTTSGTLEAVCIPDDIPPAGVDAESSAQGEALAGITLEGGCDVAAHTPLPPTWLLALGLLALSRRADRRKSR